MPKPLSLHPVDSWQTQLRDAITDGEQLLAMLGLSAEDTGYCVAAIKDFGLKVPLAFIQRMQPGDPLDPLLRQVLAHGNELLETPGYHRDPVGETGSGNPRPGILHKYQGRALLIVTSGCAINCRYCFRRHFPYDENRVSRRHWQQSLTYIAEDPSITEVLLSGGDPLVATDDSLADLVSNLAAIPHVKRLRIHSRLPVVLPARITDNLIESLLHPGLKTVMVLHANHANEIDAEVDRAIALLATAGITLLNQSVLLAGVNDTAKALAELNERLFEAGVLPYYLHLLDKVHGAAHFDVPERQARQLMGELTALLPGYLVPRLVREVEGAGSKIGVPAIY